MSCPLLLLSNPKCGDGQGPAFVNEHVLPLLADHTVHVDRHIVTAAPGHAASEFLTFIGEHSDASDMTLILASGDGTLHEIINAVYNAALARPLQISVSLIPTGTANALFSSFFSSALCSFQAGEISLVDYKLGSLRALLRNRRSAVPLTITKATVRSPKSAIDAVYFSAVVTSTALHASILHDSETLREQIPDLSRFKIAAENNISRWYAGVVKFQPRQGGEVTVYDHFTHRFVPFVGDENGPLEPTMYGPFAYFLSTVNVDRLEPSFVISPLHTGIRPEISAMDIIIIRPHRDHTISREHDSGDDHLRFADKLGLALRAAYRNGAHVTLNYSENGAINEDQGREGSRSLVEYVRCAGSWRWFNTGTEVTHLCVDGTIVNIEAGGEAECQVTDSSTLKFGILV